MEGLIFAILIVVVLVVTYARKRKKRRAKDEQLQLPARTPETAEMINHPRQIDIFVRRQRCHCGGKVYVCAESPVSGYKDMRVAVCECMRCEDIHRFYFEIEYLH